MSELVVKNLCKDYPRFSLKNVCFSLEKGKITGFIGRNGAGKTTTLKSLINFLHPSSGEVLFFGKSFTEAENEIKQKIGFVCGGMSQYTKTKIKKITQVTKLFYAEWDEGAYQKYLELFKLDESKTPSQLSEGMKVKYSLAVALSHNAEILILDEPTSGLDPVSRDELLDILMELSRKGKTVLFSTHITSDLDKCADNIIYIKNGEIIAENEITKFISSYKAVEFEKTEPSAQEISLLIGCKRSKNGYTALVKTTDADKINAKVFAADLEWIMVHMEKEADDEKTAG